MAIFKGNRPAPVSSAPSALDKALPYVLGPLIFLGITCGSRLFSVIMAGLFLLLTVRRSRLSVLRGNLSLLTTAVWVYSLICLLSGLWCHYRHISAAESARILTALSLFGIVLFHIRKEQIRTLLASLTGAIAAVGLLCLDAAGTQVLVKLHKALMGLFDMGISLSASGYESGIRITGIFNNANVSGGLLAFGLLISLYLYQTASTRQSRILVCLALGVQALSFFLSFSMGAMASFALACLVYILCAGKGSRFPLFLLMLECVAVTVVCSFAAFPLLGGGMSGGTMLLLLAFLNGALIFGLDTVLGSRMVKLLAGHDRVVGIAAGTVAAVAVVYVVLAFRLTGGTVLTPGQTLERAVAPAPGTYSVSVAGVDADVRIYTQNEADLMMHTETTLYEGPLSQASFTVPEDSEVVWFQLSGQGALDAVTLSDGTKVPLGYKLLPGFAANRLQALWANQNFIQRFVFFRDGISLWLQSPIIGWGLGGVEGQTTAVQSFFYESKYIHNHFIQMLAEAGVVGLAGFLFLLGSALWLLARGRKKGSPLLPMLAACLTMMTAHAMTEVVWSTLPVTAAAFLIFAVITLEFHDPDTAPLFKKAEVLSAAALWAVALAFGALLLGNHLAAGQRQAMQENTQGQTRDTMIASLKKIDTMDVYNNISDKANLMSLLLQKGDLAGATAYAGQLLDNQEFDSAYYVAAYYYLPVRDMEGLFAAMHTGLLQERSNPDAWRSAFNLFADVGAALDAKDVPAFLTGVAQTGAMLEQVNAQLMAPIRLDADHEKLLATAQTLIGTDAETAHAILQSVLVG